MGEKYIFFLINLTNGGLCWGCGGREPSQHQHQPLNLLFSHSSKVTAQPTQQKHQLNNENLKITSQTKTYYHFNETELGFFTSLTVKTPKDTS